MNRHRYGTIVTTLGVLILSVDTLLIRLVDATAWTILWWRGILPSLCLWAGYICVYRTNVVSELKGIGKPGVWVACNLAVGSVCFVSALEYTTVANTVIMISPAPLIAALMSWAFLKERVAAKTWVAIFIVMFGVIIVARGSAGSGRLMGDLLAFVTSAMMALNFVILRHNKHINMTPTIILSGILLAIFLAPLASPDALDGDSMLAILILGLVVLPISMTLITIGPRYISAPEVGLIMQLEAVLAPTWVWLVLDETVAKSTLIGATLIISTLVVHAWLDRGKQTAIEVQGDGKL